MRRESGDEVGFLDEVVGGEGFWMSLGWRVVDLVSSLVLLVLSMSCALS